MADVLGWLKRNKEERELSISVWLSRPCWSVLLTSSPNQVFFPQCNKENDACSKFLMKQGTGRKLIRATLQHVLEVRESISVGKKT